MSKNPRKKARIKTAKKPKIDSSIAPESIIQKKPSWRLGKMDFWGDWGFNNIDNSLILKQLHQKLKNFEGMTWGEIEKKRGSRGTKLNHTITLDRINREAQDRFREIRLADEYDTLYSLHLTGSERLWGIRENEILYILWWDKHHTVYPVGLRHT